MYVEARQAIAIKLKAQIGNNTIKWKHSFGSIWTHTTTQLIQKAASYQDSWA